MKRLLILGLPLIVAALSSCSIKEELVPSEQSAPRKFRADMEQPVVDASTKAYATPEYKLYWNEGDRLSIFYGTTYNREYEFAGLDGAAAGEFERVGEDGQYITDPEITTGYDYAILPYHKKYNLCDTDGKLTTFIFAEQEFYNDRLGIGARPLMVARDKGGVLMFKHVGCYVGVRLKGDGVKVQTISIKGNNSELLAGRLLITFDDAGLPITEFDERFLANDSETVTMTLATPVELNTDDYKVFWFNLPEVTFEKGLTITVTDVDGGTCDIIKSNKLTFKRTVFYTTTADVEITPPTVPVSSVSVAPTSLNLKPGDTETLVATVLPADASNKNVTWTSSDANVASVDANGKVTAHAAGEAVITATTVDGEKTASCAVTVSDVVSYRLAIDPASAEINAGATQAFKAKLYTTTNGVENSGEEVTASSWTSDATGVATIASDGIATGVADGTANITAKYTPSGSAELTATATLKVNDVISYRLVIDPASAEINAKATQAFTAKLITITNDVEGEPAPLTSGVTWSSSSDAIATINSNGTATGVADGTATITAKYTPSGSTELTATATLKVNDVISYRLAIDPASAEINAGATQAFKAKLYTTTNGVENSGEEVTASSWTSDATGVATIANDGVATGVKDGTATITAKYTPSGSSELTATASLKVNDVVSYRLAIDPASAEIDAGATQAFKAKLYTTTNNVEDSGVEVNASSWSSNATGVATIANDGVATGVKDGTATITAKYTPSGSSELTATASLKVNDVISYSVAITPAADAKVIIGKTQAFTLTLTTTTNGTAVESPVTSENWTSSNKNVATVSNGVATGVAEGEVTITAKYTTPDNVEHTLTAPLTVTKDPNTSGDPIVIGGEEEL